MLQATQTTQPTAPADVSPLPETNEAALRMLIEQEKADEARAKKDYWEIVLDASRNKPADAKTLKTAMDILGLTIADLQHHRQAIGEAVRLYEQAETYLAAKAEKDAIEKEWIAWIEVIRPRLMKEINDRASAIVAKRSSPEQRMYKAMEALHRLRLLRHKSPADVSRFFPDDPPGSPEKVTRAPFSDLLEKIPNAAPATAVAS